LQDTSTIQKIKNSLTYEDVWREIINKSFYEFVKYFWDTIIAEQPVWNWHIKYLCDELQHIGKRVAARLPKEYDYYIINVPPGSSKSTIISEMYPLWCWTIDPTQRFICGSYASTPAEDIADKCYKIYHSEKFVRLFPELVKNSTGGKTHFQNGLLGERYTTSTGSAITGIHAHQKLIDDPMNPQIAASKLERDRANTWVTETISSRNVDDSITTTIIVMQRLHEQDTTGYLLKKQGLKIKHICIPAEISKDVRPQELSEFYVNGLFDPVRKPKQRLIVKREELGSYGYAGQMQQRPSPDEGGIIKKAWFTITTRDHPDPIEATIKFQLDTAYTKNTDNDPTAVLSYYILKNNLYITNAISVWKEFPDLIKWLPKHAKEKKYRQGSMIHVEPKASGISVVQTIKEETDLNIVESEPPTDDKLTRLHRCSPKIEAGRVFLHEGGWNEDFINQVCGFPNAEHDDEVDCLTAIIIRELMNPDDFDYSQLNSIL
jgi:predicted phage terminase large subunit-like protein